MLGGLQPAVLTAIKGVRRRYGIIQIDPLLQAKVGHVVAAMRDPNPVAAGGAERLREAGIGVDFGLLEDEARALNLGFISRMTRGRPWVRMKIAASLDGRTALASGTSRWITGADARRDGHHWRARACAVLTGIGTVKEDDPQLTVRDVETTRQPLRVVVDSRLELPLAARVLEGGNVLVAAAVDDAGKIAALRSRGAEVVVMPNPQGKVDLTAFARALGGRGLNELHRGATQARDKPRILTELQPFASCRRARPRLSLKS